MALQTAWAQLESSLDSLSAHFQSFAAAKSLNASSDFSTLDECMLEGLLSRVWQAWNNFCRSSVIGSCIGAVDGSGRIIASLPQAQTDAHVSAAAILARRQPAGPYWGGTNHLFRNEPTWGDVDVLTRILTRLKPNNAANMLAAFSSGHAQAKALQTIRNCAAHTNTQTMADIQILKSSYIVYPIAHPTHSLFWIEPTSKDYLVIHAIQEIKDTALTAIT